MKNFKCVIFIIIILLFEPVFAYSPKQGNVSAMIGPFLHQTYFPKSDLFIDAPVMGSFGIVAEGDVNDHGGVEIGLFYLNKYYFREQSGQFISEKAKTMYITMGYRYWLLSRLSGALAFYSSYSMGDPTPVASQFSSGTAPTTSAKDITEYGFDLSLQWEWALYEKFSAVVDGRYSVSITSKPKENSDHYGVLLGIKYLIQGSK